MPNFFRTLNTSSIIISLSLLVSVCFVPNTKALEVLTLHELVVHCKELKSKPESADAQYCLRYIQGFIDGALETDIRILRDFKSDSKSSLTQRAIETRMPGREANLRFGSLAGFCLADPLPLREVVDKVVADLNALDKGEKANMPARIAVDDSLRSHYPCEK